jgi:secreted Zn-dependent insulinase-like peptidase
LQILKTLIQPSCTYSKYSTGNNATLCLGDPDVHYAAVREEMKLFYERHYKKAKLGVCLVGPQHIDELKELAVTYFSPIASSTTAIIGSNEESTPNPSDKSPSYPLVNGGGYIVRINPIKELNDISLVWSLPPTRYDGI